ncbi:MAG: DUF4397 domain-containing protein [Thermostichales cyanobacterium SZTDM-1c_bins_54]
MMQRWWSLGWLGVGASLLMGLSGCSTPASVAAGVDRARVRLVNLAPNGPAVDLTIGGRPAIRYVTFGSVSPYVSLPGGNYDLAVQTVNSWFNPRLDGVIASAAASLPEFRTLSILVLNEGAKISALLVDDAATPLPDQALVRFVHGIPDGPPLVWAVDERVVFTDLAFGEVSTYFPVPPGYVVFSLQERPQPESVREWQRQGFVLQPGKAYTLYASGLLRGDPGVELLISEWDP